MDLFTKLFGEFLVLVYHCFDRIVIHGYLTALSRPELVVHFFRDIVGVGPVATCVGISRRVFGRHEVIRSCGEVNGLIGRLFE